METLSSVLTISQDFSYGELVRENYENSPVETLYFPFFEEALPLVQGILPNAIILDFKLDDCLESSAFLNQLLIFQKEALDYAPRIFVSESTSLMLSRLSKIQRKASSTTASIVQQEKVISLEQFELEDLIEILDSNTTLKTSNKIASENIETVEHPFDSMESNHNSMDPTQVSEMFRGMFTLLGSHH